MIKKKTQELQKIWFNPSHEAGFTGIEKLRKASGKSKKETKKWLSNQLSYSLNKPMRKRFPTRKYKTFHENDVWQMDLVEMIPYAKINNGYKYILTCIDVFSRVARALPLKTKSAKDVSVAVAKLFHDETPKNLQTDLGKEFYNSKVKEILKKNNINHYSVHSQFKAALVERFNRTLRDRLKKYTTEQGNKKWIKVLPSIIHSYNHSKHRSLKGLRPVDVKHNKNAYKLLSNLKEKSSKPKHKIDDYVRISKISASPFVKNFNQNWSDEVFQIVKVSTKQNPVMYSLKDTNDEVVDGKFYEPELQVIDKPKIFRIQSILKTKGKGIHKQYYVKWHGYSKPSWISENQLV